MYKLIALILLINNSTFAMDISYQFGLRQVEFKSSDNVWSMSAPGKRLSIKKADCNQDLLLDFKERLIKRIGQVPHQKWQKDTSKKFKVIRYETSTSKATYQTPPKSKTGQALLRLPDDFVHLKLQAIEACKKN